MGLNVYNMDEIELRKWCLEFVVAHNIFVHVNDINNQAEKILGFVRCTTHEGGPLKPLKADEVGDDDLIRFDWSGFSLCRDPSAVGRYSFGNSIYAADEVYQTFDPSVDVSYVEMAMKRLWVGKHGIPNKGEADD